MTSGFSIAELALDEAIATFCLVDKPDQASLYLVAPDKDLRIKVQNGNDLVTTVETLMGGALVNVCDLVTPNMSPPRVLTGTS